LEGGLGPTQGREPGAARGRKGSKEDEGEGASDAGEQGKGGRRRKKSQKQLVRDPVFPLTMPLMRTQQMKE